MAQEVLSGTQVSERGRHCLILAVGGTIWSVVAIVFGLHMFGSWLPVLVAVVIVGLLLTAGSLYVMRMAKRFPATVTHYQQMHGWYWRCDTLRGSEVEDLTECATRLMLLAWDTPLNPSGMGCRLFC